MTSPWEEQRDGWSWQISDLCLEKLLLMRDLDWALLSPWEPALMEGTSSSGSHHDSPSPLPPWRETAKQQQQHPSAPSMKSGDKGTVEVRRGRSGAGAAADAICIFARALEGRTGCQG